MKKVLLLGALLGALTLPATTPMTLGGKTATRIVISEQAGNLLRHAAKELHDFVLQRTGCDLEISNTPDEKGGNLILGDEPAITAKLPEDGFVIYEKEGNLHICGRSDDGIIYGIRNPWRACEVYNSKLKFGCFGEAGVLYGVYAFLEQCGGLRFYAPGPDGTVIPQGPFAVPAWLRISRFPAFTYRHPWFCDFEVSPDDALYYRRTGFGGKAPVQIIDSFMFFKNKFEKTHPEYFALVDGERDFGSKCAIQGGGHYCLNAPGLQEDIADIIKEYFKTHPQVKCYPLCPGDGLFRCCECPACRAEQEPERGMRGKYSYHIWKFVNDVTAIVAKDYPDRLIGCLAYSTHLEPPMKLGKLHPNVAVMLCWDRKNNSVPARRAETEAAVAGWHKLTDRPLYAWVWCLEGWIPWRQLPFMTPHAVANDIRWMRKQHFAGEFTEYESWQTDTRTHKINYPATMHLNLTIMARLQWNPDLDVDTFVDEYCRLYYGPAADSMRKFIAISEEGLAKGAQSLKGNTLIPAEVFPPASLNEQLALLQKAIAQCPEDSVYRRRLNALLTEFTAGRRTLVAMARKDSPVIIAQKTAGKINVDGRAAEKTWREGGGSQFVTKSGEAAAPKTQVYCRHDSKNLYFLVLMQEPKIDRLRTKATQQTLKGIYLDDCLEIFLRSENENPLNCQFIINAAGALWQAQLSREHGTPANEMWRSGAVAAVQKTGKRITMEISIPLAPLGLNPGDTVKMNLYRSRVVDEGQSFSCWSPTFTERHYTPEKFGTLRLQK